ncbi:MAG: hypothetical protein GC152_06235 [Alphaproteobacteria bacterium]|nr:hypothetical protein [Alphaproteobacteria bacterium]
MSEHQSSVLILLRAIAAVFGLTGFGAVVFFVRADYREHVEQDRRIAALESRLLHAEQVIASEIDEMMSSTPALRGLWRDVARDYPALRQDYLDEYLRIVSAERPPATAMVMAARVIDAAWKDSLPRAPDEIYFRIAGEYAVMVDQIRARDPAFCVAYLQGREAFRGEALFSLFGVIQRTLRFVAVADGEPSIGSEADARRFARRALGPARYAAFVNLESDFETVCNDLKDLFISLEADPSPEAASAARYWTQPWTWRGRGEAS